MTPDEYAALDELIVGIAIEILRALDELDKTQCGHVAIVMEKAMAVGVVCNLQKGHAAEMHTNGANEWSD